jgi:hypothetical protein
MEEEDRVVKRASARSRVEFGMGQSSIEGWPFVFCEMFVAACVICPPDADL